MKAGTIGASFVAWGGALLSSLCCLLPLAVIVLGLGTGGFMAEMTADLLTRLAGDGDSVAGRDMKGMGGR